MTPRPSPAAAEGPTSLDRYRGCLLGGAVGDALGAAVEFDDLATIRRRFGSEGIADPAEAFGRVGAFTDDTQMTLFTAEGLLQADDRLESGVANPPGNLGAAYQRWLDTQGERSERQGEMVWHGELHLIPALRSRRAPGTTCLSALRAVRGPEDWDRRATNTSKGCGGVMRAAPCGLVDEHWGEDGPFRIAVASAGLTHGHPSGHLAAGALAVIIDRIRRGTTVDIAAREAVGRVRQEPESAEVAEALVSALSLAEQAHPLPEVVERLGQGWVAEEALAIAVFCVAALPTDFEAAVRLAANHSGDSDSTAAIAGNISGTLLGVGAIPERWLALLEERELIDRLAVALHERLVQGRLRIDWRRWDIDHDPLERQEVDAVPRRSNAPRHASEPPDDAYWVEPGSLMAGPYPGAKEKHEAEQKLKAFLDAGVTCFLDLTQEGESGLRPYGALLRGIAAGRGIDVVHLRLPVSDLEVPTEWRMRLIQTALREAVDAEQTVYVHCWGGVGRTGTAVGCRLIEVEGLSGQGALDRVARLRSSTQRAHRSSPETPAQRDMVLGWHKTAFGHRA